MRSSPGAYVLLVFLPDPLTVQVGALGRLDLPAGHYLYCGSAQAGLLPRLARHMRPDKKVHWHIDSLTSEGQVIGALTFEGGKETECRLARFLSYVPFVLPAATGFGSSDCHCHTHLFYVGEDTQLSFVLNALLGSFQGRELNGESI